MTISNTKAEKTKPSSKLVKTPGGAERAPSSIHGIFRGNNLVVLTGNKGTSIDYKKYDSDEAAIKAFNNFSRIILSKSKTDKNAFVQMPNGDLIRENHITSLEPLNAKVRGIIVRCGGDSIIAFIQEVDEDKQDIIVSEILQALEPASPSKKHKPDWVALGIV